MQPRTGRSVAIALVSIVALTIAAVPIFAAPASQHYQVATNKNQVRPGETLTVTATIKQAAPGCAYSVLLTVSGPGGVSGTDSVTVGTEAGGNGHTAASLPADFGGADTNALGTYTVSATFTCGYATGAASTTFTVAS